MFGKFGVEKDAERGCVLAKAEQARPFDRRSGLRVGLLCMWRVDIKLCGFVRTDWSKIDALQVSNVSWDGVDDPLG